MKTATITRDDETLCDAEGRLVGYIADDGRFHPCGAPLTADQMREILAMLDLTESERNAALA